MGWGRLNSRADLSKNRCKRPPEKLGPRATHLVSIKVRDKRVSTGGVQGDMMTPGDLDLRLSEQIRTLFEVGSLGALPDSQLLDRFLVREELGSDGSPSN